jgi:adenylate cyclase
VRSAEAAREPAGSDLPSSAAVREQLKRILSSIDFRANRRRKQFLQYVVEETLAGRAERLKGFSIAVELLDRDETFDPQTDPVVRLEARQLRRDLEHYYLTGGQRDPIRISIPKGGYVPVFESLELPESGRSVLERPLRERSGGIRSGGRAWWLVLASVPIVAAVGLGLAVWWSAFRPPSDVAAGVPSVAVLPLANLSNDPAQDYFAKGMTAELINALTRFEHLVTVSRGVTSSYQNEGGDVRQIGNDLAAAYVLTGSLRKGSDRLRIGVELADTETAKLLWSDSFDRSLTSGDLLDIQQTIADQVARVVAGPYGVLYRAGLAKSEPRPPSDFSAYDCVLRLYAYWTTRSPAEHLQVRDCLESAVVREPNYAAAWAGLAYLYLDEVRDGFNPRPDAYDALDRALEVAKRAVHLAPESATAHQALYVTHFIRNEVPEFVEVGERALTLNPHNADVVADFGFKLAVSGHWNRGIALLEEAIAVSPVHPSWWHFAFVLNHYRQHQYEQSLAEALKIDMPEYYMTHVVRAMSYGQLGRADEARLAVEQITQRKPDYAVTVREDFRRRNLPEPLIEHIVEGLQKAGLGHPRPA